MEAVDTLGDFGGLLLSTLLLSTLLSKLCCESKLDGKQASSLGLFRSAQWLVGRVVCSDLPSTYQVVGGLVAPASSVSFCL